MGGETGGGYQLSLCFFFCGFVFCHLTFSIPLFRWLEHNRCIVSLFFLCFFYLWPLSLKVTSAHKLLYLLCKTILKVKYQIIIMWISLEKGECFYFNHSLGFVYPILYITGQVYHFRMLICYPCSFVNGDFFFFFFQNT